MAIGTLIKRAGNRAIAWVKRLSQLRFELDSSSICARFELDLIREPCHNCDSIREWEILECSNRAHIESNRNCDRILESNRIESSSNRAHIELESSSNRNCDRRLTAMRSRAIIDGIDGRHSNSSRLLWKRCRRGNVKPAVTFPSVVFI